MSLCIAITAVSFANVAIETLVSADKSAVYNKYRNGPRTVGTVGLLIGFRESLL